MTDSLGLSTEQYDIAKKNGIPKRTVQRRVKNNWPIKKAISVPVRKKRRPKKDEDIEKAISEGITYEQYLYMLNRVNSSKEAVSYWRLVAKKNKISVGVFRNRRYAGWDLERAATEPTDKGKLRSDSKWIEKAIKNGISKKLFKHRVDILGWSPEGAATRPARNLNIRTDREWIKVANGNGISFRAYTNRVDNLFWDPEEAATTPVMSRDEVVALAMEGKEAANRMIQKRINQDPNNLFKITDEHRKIAASNGIRTGTLEARVYRYGWTVQEAISIPLKRWVDKPEEYEKYLQQAIDNGIEQSTFYHRLKRGWDIVKASTTSTILPSTKKKFREEDIETAKKNGISYKTFSNRVYDGWSTEDASTIPPLPRGQFHNEERTENALNGLKGFQKI
ncbi:hypothetical protein [Bacillus mesophilum]|uniref:Uncharacterized protein n=1 Tax=Bacillus mesophilum TaxID=1071718 RepID=A0A7V7UZS1_9BACI|nr:hypothetical protein [Bacillus mesophilum]KAB2334277.1 hypothetical protein F7732_09410 [Bacillus mesophilum]